MKLAALAFGVVVGMLTLGATACGNDERAEGGKAQAREKAGRITEIEKLQLFIDGDPIDRHVEIFARNVLKTDQTGLASFELDRGTSCQLKPNAELRVQPQPGTAVRFIDGTSWCSKAAGEEMEEYETPEAKILVEDPVFGVTVEGSETVISVTFGFVRVVAEDGELTVGPEQQAVVSPTGGLRLEEIRLTKSARLTRIIQ